MGCKPLYCSSTGAVTLLELHYYKTKKGKRMLITLLVEPSGTVYIALPKAQESGYSTSLRLVNGVVQNTIRVGSIIEHELESTFSVEFQVDFLKEFNKDGFSSRQSAVEYEQRVLNKHLPDYLDKIRQGFTE